MRTRLKSHDEVAHYWANKIQDEGRAGNMLFHNKTIYSYGRHFPISKHITVKGKDVVLFTTRSYSVSTRQHIGIAESACSHLSVLYVHNATASTKDEHLANVKNRMETIGELLDKAKRARKYADMHCNSALKIFEELKVYAALFLPRHKFDFSSLGGISAEHAAIVERELKRTAADNRKAAKEYSVKVKEWKAGKANRLPCPVNGYSHNTPVYLRVKGDNVETSKYAEVPRHQAKLFFALCKKCRDAKRAITKFSHKVGLYSPTSIDEKGNAVVNCHMLPFEEMEAISGQL